MFAKMIRRTFGTPRLWAAAATVAAAVGVPGAAQARHGLHIDLVVPVTPVYATPAYATPVYPDPCPPPVVVEAPSQPVWVEPVYRTVCDRQWVPPVTQTVCRPVWVADRYAYRTVATCDRWGRPCYAQQCVLVAAGHYEDVAQQQVVCDGHWQTVERQELVAPGHWEARYAAPVAAYPVASYPAVAYPVAPPDEFRVRLRF